MNKTPVSILQEMMVKQGMIPDYELIHDGGGRHVNTFTYQVTCDGLSASGMGRCKKDAKHEAAKAMLAKIASQRNYRQLPAANTPAESPPRSPFHSNPPPAKVSTNVPFFNAIGELQDLCAENQLQDPQYVLIRDVGPAHARIFTIRCIVSNFREDGVATTKKQAKHDAAKKMVQRIKGLVDELYEFEIDRNEDKNEEELNNKAKKYYQTFVNTKKVNLGIKLSDYHIKLKDSLEVEKRKTVLNELRRIFSDELLNDSAQQINVTNALLMEKLAMIEILLTDLNITINMKDISAVENSCFLTAIALNTCPPLLQIGMGSSKLIASWEALLQIVKTLRILLLD